MTTHYFLDTIVFMPTIVGETCLDADDNAYVEIFSASLDSLERYNRKLRYTSMFANKKQSSYRNGVSALPGLIMASSLMLTILVQWQMENL
jgi:RAB protein geranylgeranyltransferase component A